ncbi:hypothetical protein U1Q18_025677 [Sarracenia purpurea var. burkii]
MWKRYGFRLLRSSEKFDSWEVSSMAVSSLMISLSWFSCFGEALFWATTLATASEGRKQEPLASNKVLGEDEARNSEMKVVATPILVRSSLVVEAEPETVKKDEEAISDNDSGDVGSDLESEDVETEGASGEESEEKTVEDGGKTEVYTSELNLKPSKKGDADLSRIGPDGGKKDNGKVEATIEASYSGEFKTEESGDKVLF